MHKRRTSKEEDVVQPSLVLRVLILERPERRTALPKEPRSLWVDIVDLFETRRPGRGEISSGVYTCNWSIMTRRYSSHVGSSCRLQPFLVEVTAAVERIMRVWLTHSLGFISPVGGYAVYIV